MHNQAVSDLEAVKRPRAAAAGSAASVWAAMHSSVSSEDITCIEEKFFPFFRQDDFRLPFWVGRTKNTNDKDCSLEGEELLLHISPEAVREALYLIALYLSCNVINLEASGRNVWLLSFRKQWKFCYAKKLTVWLHCHWQQQTVKMHAQTWVWNSHFCCIGSKTALQRYFRIPQTSSTQSPP